MKLKLNFGNKAALDAAVTYLVNQNAPFRNASVSVTAGVDVNTGEKVFEHPKEVFQVEFFTETWTNRAEREIKTLFEANDYGQTFTRV